MILELGERAEQLVQDIAEIGFDDSYFGLGDRHDLRPVVGDRDGLWRAAPLPGWRNREAIVVEIGRPGPHSLGPADRGAIVALGAIHPLTMDPNGLAWNRPSARRSAMRNAARKEKRWADRGVESA